MISGYKTIGQVALDSLTRCRSLREESCQAKTIKEERGERARARKRELMPSDFLGPVIEIFGSALVPMSQIPRILPISSLFP